MGRESAGRQSRASWPLGSGVPVNVLLLDALWGFVGGVGYAGTRLFTTIWGGPEVEARAQRLAISQFIISIMLSPAAAASATPALTAYINASSPALVAFMVGLSFNAIWPLLVEKGFLRKLIAETMAMVAEKIRPGS